MEEKSDLIMTRIAKAEDLRKLGINPFSNDFKVQNTISQIFDKYQTLPKETVEQSTEVFSIAGRIMFSRSFGKACFIKITDRTGAIQVYIRKDMVGDSDYDVFSKLIDIGDIVGVQGTPFVTRTGELSLVGKKIRILTKSIRPLPEKFHGLTDIETRYRQRYVDLIMNTESNGMEVRQIFKTRSRIIQFIRSYLDSRDFIEVETPMMHPIPGGAAARPFITHHNTLDIDLYLRIAPELYLKRLLVGGFERVYEVNRNFRNEGISTRHNPEFTMLEFYWAYADYLVLMDLIEDLLNGLVRHIHSRETVVFQDQTLDFKKPFHRISIKQGIIQQANLNEAKYDELTQDISRMQGFLKELGLEVEKGWPMGKLIMILFETFVEPTLVQPTIVYDFPLDVSPLSRKKETDPTLVDRFELYIGGLEVANAFSELNDPIDQAERFSSQAQERESGDEEAHLMDQDYVRALEYGMPPAAGLGLGIDRMVMLLTNQPSIRDVILFPQLKPER